MIFENGMLFCVWVLSYIVYACGYTISLRKYIHDRIKLREIERGASAFMLMWVFGGAAVGVLRVAMYYQSKGVSL